MKYRKRFKTYSLLAGLIVSIDSCKPTNQPPVELLASKTLTTFPSASAIEYSDERFYVFGDDATYLLVLDSSWNQVDTVHYITDTAYRISKQTKPDIESATIINYNGEKFLYALGSFSTPNRKKLFYFPLSSLHSFLQIELGETFQKRIQKIPELNFEGLAFVKSKMIIANRANATHRTNQFIIAGNNFNETNATSPFPVVNILLDSSKTIGISGLCYSEDEDQLIFTASEEDTPSATQDGVIGDSYIGWIDRFSVQMQEQSIKPDGMIKLSSIDKAFVKTKIESVCIEKTLTREFVLNLVADNDNGQSRIFRIRLRPI